MQRLLFLLVALFVGFGAQAADAPKFELKDGDRVVFLGDTFIEREQLESYIETMFTIRFPDKNAVFRNLGWSADTPLGESRASFDPPEKGFDRIKEHLQQIKPSVVILSHGMANSFKGQPGLAIFEGDMRKLCKAIEDISGPGVRFVFLGPIPHEKLPAPLPDPAKHNEQLKLYSDALKKLAAEKNAPFVDLFRLVAALESKTPLTDNGIHLTPYGYWRVAQVIESALGLASPLKAIAGPEMLASNLAINNFKSDNKSASFEATPFRHVFAPSPIQLAENRSAGAKIGVKTLPLGRGDYTLKINGSPIAVASAPDWALGVDVNTGPLFYQIEELRQTIVKKNQLYFYRWRPQNETYLFGFRKHEQGQNAREIPMFDPLVSEQEGKIADLKKFRPFKFEFAATTAEDRKLAGKPTQAPKPAPAPAKKVESLPIPTFEMAEGLEATLYAEDPELAKPIQMNFDTEGRLWVASSSVYPQIQPGQTANDKIMVLEDTNHDGKVDKARTFAEGLLIPTGVIPGDGGCYVANSTELLFFQDTDGDGKADTKRVVLSGFGTEDTHHILHTLRWGFDGQLYFNQSIYIHSHVETPHGVMRLNSGGIWNFRPETGELGIHMKGLVNCWGHHYDKFGQSFATDGASGGEGIEWVVPQGMYFTYAGARRVLKSISPGNYPKFASLEMVESEHFPADWMGTLVTCDFRAHRVVRFSINENGSSYITKELPDVMRTTNVTFRPIDVKVGPDGALYVADWSNPIIQHGEVDFRDPRRDHEHGRIWRITYKGRPLLKDPALTKSTVADTFDQLLSPNNYVRERARRILTEKRHAIMGDLQRWTAKQTTEQGLLEALWIYQSIDVANQQLLEKVLAAKDGRIRAAATRVLSFWRDRINNTPDLLARLVTDDVPRVRVEAMRALAKIPTAKSAELVLPATEKPMDEFLEYTAWLSINDLAEPWIASIKSGDWKPAGHEKQLAYGLGALTPEMAAAVLPTVLPQGNLPNDGPWIDLVGKAGSPAELTRLLDQTLSDGFNPDATARAYAALADAARTRNTRPSGDLARLEKPIASAPERIRTEAIKLAGTWKVASLSPKLLEIARTKETPAPIRQASLQSLRDIGGRSAAQGLLELAGPNSDLAIRQQAVVTLAALNLKQAAPAAIEVLTATTDENQSLALWRSLLSIRGAAPEFAHALPKTGLPPVMAKTGLRVAREGGRNEPSLVLALARNVENEEESKNLTPQELQSLIANVTKNGDPARGEMIYRRQEIGCTSCHSIGGIGGKVGPDMTSIGASAQIDYLVESIQFPNRKIKEGFHSIQVETKDDQEISGILVRETDTQLILRDVANKEVAIAKNNINNRKTGASLMPAGLIDTLSPQDQIDLYRFLSELGKPGPYDASKGNVARYYKTFAATIDTAQFGDDKVIARAFTDPAWGPASTLVDGSLLKADLERQIARSGNRAQGSAYAATQFSSPKEGAIHLKIEGAIPQAVYIDGKPVQNTAAPEMPLKPGPHTLILKLDANKLPEKLRVTSEEVTFATTL